VDRHFGLPSVTGSCLANHTTGYVGDKLYGRLNGHLNKSLLDAVPKKSDDMPIMMPFITDEAVYSEDSGIGSKV
jgi:hypothetical protein